MSSQLPTVRPVGSAELVHAFPEHMPTGVTVADDGRIFVCYPRWGDPLDFTVAELRDGEEVAYPSAALNVFDKHRPADCLVSVQSVVVDPAQSVERETRTRPAMCLRWAPACRGVSNLSATR